MRGAVCYQPISHLNDEALNVIPQLIVLFNAHELKPAAVFEENDHVTPEAQPAADAANFLDFRVLDLHFPLEHRRAGSDNDALVRETVGHP